MNSEHSADLACLVCIFHAVYCAVPRPAKLLVIRSTASSTSSSSICLIASASSLEYTISLAVVPNARQFGDGPPLTQSKSCTLSCILVFA